MYILAGFEPGAAVPQADAMSTSPRRRQGNKMHHLSYVCSYIPELKYHAVNVIYLYGSPLDVHK
jgi:hypothetical protein